MSKFDARMAPGAFCGWFTPPGHKWSGDYLVLPNSNRQNYGGYKYLHRVKEIDIPEKIECPVKEDFEKKRKTISLDAEGDLALGPLAVMGGQSPHSAGEPREPDDPSAPPPGVPPEAPFNVFGPKTPTPW
jgi:hypothetical protein